MKNAQPKMVRYTFRYDAWKEIQALVFQELKNMQVSRIVAKQNKTGDIDCELYFSKGTDSFNCEPNRLFQNSIVKAMQNEEIDRDTSIALNYALANCCKPVFQTFEGGLDD